MRPIFASLRVVPMTTCPAATRRGRRFRPMAPVAPATRMRMVHHSRTLLRPRLRTARTRLSRLLEAKECECDSAEHQAPPHMPPTRGDGIAHRGIPVDDNRHRNDPLAGSLRTERWCGNQQNAHADPVECAGLPYAAQQIPRGLWLDSRLWEHPQLGDGTMSNCNENGQYARGLKCQISHAPPPYRSAWCEINLPDCGGQYTIVWCDSMTKRLTAQDWIDFGLITLAREGFDTLKADILARKLKVSRGSFYWHFRDLGTFHAKVIERWRQTATEAIIADVERFASSEERVEALLRHAFGHSGGLEMRVRAWADNNADAARALKEVDRRRQWYIERLLIAAGVTKQRAATRTQLLYWTYLGAALSGSRLTGERLDGMVAELKRISLGALPSQTTVAEDRYERRRPSRRGA